MQNVESEHAAVSWQPELSRKLPERVLSDSEAYSGGTAGRLSEPEGAACSTTRRIVVVSPRPAALNELVGALTERCYDVLLFHRTDDPVLKLLQADLWIVDLTSRGLETPLERKYEPVLTLVQRGSAPAADAAALVWPGELAGSLARIDAALEQPQPLRLQAMRTEPAATAEAEDSGDKLRFRDVTLDRKRMTVQRRGSRVELTKTEFELLAALLAAGGGVLSRQELLDRVWGEQYFGGSNTVDVHIKSLRQKLGDDPRKQHIIATVRGVGYRLAD